MPAREFGDLTSSRITRSASDLKKQLYAAGVPKIEIERTTTSSPSTARARAKPGMVIGKGGAEREQLERLTKKIGKTVKLNIVEVKQPRPTLQLVAENIAQQLEKRISFRRAMKQQCHGPRHARRRQGHQGYAAPAVWAALKSPAYRELSRGHHPPADPARRHRLRLC